MTFHNDEIADDMIALVTRLNGELDEQPLSVDSVLVLWRGVDADGTAYHTWHAAGDRKLFDSIALLEAAKLDIVFDSKMARRDLDDD